MSGGSRQERIGSALHALAADLVTERRKVVVLERENERLKAQLERLQVEVAALQQRLGETSVSTLAARRPRPPIALDGTSPPCPAA